MNHGFPEGKEWDSLRRIFGTYEAYRASLPKRIWVSGLNGWYSLPRD